MALGETDHFSLVECDKRSVNLTTLTTLTYFMHVLSDWTRRLHAASERYPVQTSENNERTNHYTDSEQDWLKK